MNPVNPVSMKYLESRSMVELHRTSQVEEVAQILSGATSDEELGKFQFQHFKETRVWLNDQKAKELFSSISHN